MRHFTIFHFVLLAKISAAANALFFSTRTTVPSVSDDKTGPEHLIFKGPVSSLHVVAGKDKVLPTIPILATPTAISSLQPRADSNHTDLEFGDDLCNDANLLLNDTSEEDTAFWKAQFPSCFSHFREQTASRSEEAKPTETSSKITTLLSIELALNSARCRFIKSYLENHPEENRKTWKLEYLYCFDNDFKYLAPTDKAQPSPEATSPPIQPESNELPSLELSMDTERCRRKKSLIENSDADNITKARQRMRYIYCFDKKYRSLAPLLSLEGESQSSPRAHSIAAFIDHWLKRRDIQSPVPVVRSLSLDKTKLPYSNHSKSHIDGSSTQETRHGETEESKQSLNPTMPEEQENTSSNTQAPVSQQTNPPPSSNTLPLRKGPPPVYYLSDPLTLIVDIPRCRDLKHRFESDGAYPPRYQTHCCFKRPDKADERMPDFCNPNMNINSAIAKLHGSAPGFHKLGGSIWGRGEGDVDVDEVDVRHREKDEFEEGRMHYWMPGYHKLAAMIWGKANGDKGSNGEEAQPETRDEKTPVYAVKGSWTEANITNNLPQVHVIGVDLWDRGRRRGSNSRVWRYVSGVGDRGGK